MLVSWLLVTASGASPPLPSPLAPLVPPDLCRVADPPADAAPTPASKASPRPTSKAPAKATTGKPADQDPTAPGAEVRLACTGSTGSVLDAFAKRWGGQVLHKEQDRVVILRWAARGSHPVDVVAAYAEGGGIYRVEAGRVPDPGGKASDRCGVAHVEGKLPVADGTAAFCLAVGGPPRLDGPIEVATSAWRVVGSYRDGARVGPWRVTDAAGLPVADGEFAADAPTGTWTVRGAQVKAGEGQPSSVLAFHELLSQPADAAGASAAVDVIDADLEKGVVAVRVRWQAPASEPDCDTVLGDPRAGLGFAVLRPGVAEPAGWWVVARRAPGEACPTADEVAARLKEVRAELAAHGLDPVLPPPAVSPISAAPPAFEVEGHRIAVPPKQEASGVAELEPAELVARLPWLGATAGVQATLDDTPVERWRAPSVGEAAPELSVPAVLADRGRWAVVYQLRMRDGDREHHAVLVGPVHSLGEAL